MKYGWSTPGYQTIIEQVTISPGSYITFQRSTGPSSDADHNINPDNRHPTTLPFGAAYNPFGHRDDEEHSGIASRSDRFNFVCPDCPGTKNEDKKIILGLAKIIDTGLKN